jgi:hypothetical protein
MLNHILKQVWRIEMKWETDLLGIEMDFDQGEIQ